jgi:hypothetical protein
MLEEVSLLGAPDLRLDADLWTEDGYLLQNEWPIYAFDAIPMAIVLVICVAWMSVTSLQRPCPMHRVIRLGWCLSPTLALRDEVKTVSTHRGMP